MLTHIWVDLSAHARQSVKLALVVHFVGWIARTCPVIFHLGWGSQNPRQFARVLGLVVGFFLPA